MSTETGTVTLDELLSRPGWRESLHSSHTALKEAADLWLSESSLIISLEGLRYMNAGDTELPQGFEDLTRELCKWCDAGQTSIDPTPLLRFLRQVVDLLALNRWELVDRREEAIDKLRVLFDDAWDVLDRMLYAAFEQAGEEQPKLIGVTPRYKSPPCPKCGEESRVTSTRESLRHVKCRNESCGHQWKLAKST